MVRMDPQPKDILKREKFYVVAYDFGEKPPTIFYKHLNRILADFFDGVKLQKSVVICKNKDTAEEIFNLAISYGAKTVLLLEAKCIKLFDEKQK